VAVHPRARVDRHPQLVIRWRSAVKDRSWFDRHVVRWLLNRPIPWWVIVVIAGIASAALSTAIIWMEGSAPVGWFGRPTWDAFYAPFSLFLYVYLARSARRGLERFRPALEMEDFEHLLPRLTGLTGRQAALSFAAGAVIGLNEVVTHASSGAARTAIIGESTLALLVIGTLNGVLGYGLGILALGLLVRVLVGIAAAHRLAVDVDLLRPGPIHAFAPVSARAGAFVIILGTYSAVTDPDTFRRALLLVISAAFGSVAVLAFLLPLLGMRRRLVAKKAELLDDASQRLARVDEALRQVVDAGHYDQTAPLITTRGVLQAQHDRIDKASTLPWDTSTLRGFATTLLIPVITWLLTTLLNRTLFN
jgi:hypothetical protein